MKTSCKPVSHIKKAASLLLCVMMAIIMLMTLLFFTGCGVNKPKDQQVRVEITDIAEKKTYIAIVSKDSDIVIGRQSTSTIVISGDQYISRTHCQLSYRDGSIYLTDLGSTNGTYINSDGEWVIIDKDVKLTVGEQFMIADKIFELSAYDVT